MVITTAKKLINAAKKVVRLCKIQIFNVDQYITKNAQKLSIKLKICEKTNQYDMIKN